MSRISSPSNAQLATQEALASQQTKATPKEDAAKAAKAAKKPELLQQLQPSLTLVGRKGAGRTKLTAMQTTASTPDAQATPARAGAGAMAGLPTANAADVPLPRLAPAFGMDGDGTPSVKTMASLAKVESAALGLVAGKEGLRSKLLGASARLREGGMLLIADARATYTGPRTKVDAGLVDLLAENLLHNLGTTELEEASAGKLATNIKAAMAAQQGRFPLGMDINAFVQAVLRESYMLQNEELRDFADRVKHFNELKKAARARLTTARQLRVSMPADGELTEEQLAELIYFHTESGNWVNYASGEIVDPLVTDESSEPELVLSETDGAMLSEEEIAIAFARVTFEGLSHEVAGAWDDTTAVLEATIEEIHELQRAKQDGPEAMRPHYDSRILEKRATLAVLAAEAIEADPSVINQLDSEQFFTLARAVVESEDASLLDAFTGELDFIGLHKFQVFLDHEKQSSHASLSSRQEYLVEQQKATADPLHETLIQAELNAIAQELAQHGQETTTWDDLWTGALGGRYEDYGSVDETFAGVTFPDAGATEIPSDALYLAARKDPEGPWADELASRMFDGLPPEQTVALMEAVAADPDCPESLKEKLFLACNGSQINATLEGNPEPGAYETFSQLLQAYAPTSGENASGGQAGATSNGSGMTIGGIEEGATAQEILDGYIKDAEDSISTIGDDAQLANVDLQNALQKQQQTLQMMSNISKMLHDTAMSIIRKIGG